MTITKDFKKKQLLIVTGLPEILGFSSQIGFHYILKQDLREKMELFFYQLVQNLDKESCNILFYGSRLPVI